jgi:hypothetical protein
MLSVDRSVLKTPAIRALILLAFCGGIAWWIFWPRGLPPPNEKDRTMHPAGYSIIVPAEWEARVDETTADAIAKDRLHLRPIREGYNQPEILVTRLRRPPDAAQLKLQEQFHDGEFQSTPALIHDRPVKKYWVYKAVFPRGGEWFEVSVALADYENVPRSGWYPYLTSFRYPDPKYVPPPSKAANRPANSPTTFRIDVGH